MITYSIKDKEIFRIEEAATNQFFYGTDQEWYKKKWQRMSGCGPSAVANIIYYFNCTRFHGNPHLTKQDYVKLMEEVWTYVTPSLGGVSSTGMLISGAKGYLEKKSLNIRMDAIDIPKKKQPRPDFGLVLSFLSKALTNDTPVAFLNLDHGTVLEVDSWHWVTIISLEYEKEHNSVSADILDGGLIKRIDLLRWYETTKLGGGFVSFTPE
jgi:hypothetical protein